MADFSAIRALAFDLDVTSVDSVPSLAVNLDLALVEMGLSPAGGSVCWHLAKLAYVPTSCCSSAIHAMVSRRAQGAGCPCVGLAYGYNYGESIALSHPDCVLERFADLLPVLGLSSLEDQEI